MQNAITTQDLLAILEIINLAASRNAFRVEEFLGIGSVYTKLSAILEQNMAQNSAEQTSGSQEKETTND